MTILASSSSSSSSSSTSPASIQVVVRLRPINEKEQKVSTLPVIKASTQHKTVTVIKGQGSRQARNNFAFDNVFTAFSTQQEVFEATLKPVIRDVMQGYESTVFAYGQTGTGKTHTMEGSLHSTELHGIIPRSAQAIFEAIDKPEYENTCIKCSYLEIYNEELGDLLADTSGNGEEIRYSQSGSPSRKKKLEIMEGQDGPFCRGLKEVEVKSADDVFNLMINAQQHRKVGETKMNRHSSRSHCLFTIKVDCKKKLKNGGGCIDFCGKLHMVDLAGSECAKSAGNDKGSNAVNSARERERLNINRSLLTLGRVIKILKEQGEKGNKKSGSVRIPYRDSKLTRILQESLGGRCKTLIIATLSPSVLSIEESLSTLHYAQSANGIINKPISNSKMSVGSMSFHDTASTSSDPNAVDTWQEMECRLEYMQNQVEEAQAALARKHLQQQEFLDRAEKAEGDVLLKQNELDEANLEKIRLKDVAEKERAQRRELAKLQHETEIALKKTKAILDATQHTEDCLTKEANVILMSLEESIKDGDKLHSELFEAREDMVQKRDATKSFHVATASLLSNIIAKLDNLSSLEKANKNSLSMLAASGNEREKAALERTIDLIAKISSDVQTMTLTIEDHVDGDEGMGRVLDEMVIEVANKASATKVSIVEGEEALSRAFNDAHRRLEEYSTQINSMNSKFLDSSERIASSIESRIMESKEKVSAFVSSASKAMGEIKDMSAKSSEELGSILQTILDNTTFASSSIVRQANDGNFALNSALGIFESKRNFDEMEVDLQGQDRLMKGDGKAHVEEIANLRHVIESQRESFAKAAIKQANQQNEALSQIFSGVQRMVDEQISQLKEANEKQFNSFNAMNDNMLEVSDMTNTSAHKIFTSVDGYTTALQQKVIDARINDELVGTAAEKASNTFNDISNATHAHKCDIDAVITIGTGHVEDLTKSNEALVASINEMETAGQNTSIFMDTRVASEAKSGIETLNQCTNDLSTFASDTILKCVENDIKTMEKPRAEWKSTTESSVDNIASVVKESSERLSQVMVAQTSTAKELSTLVDSTHGDFVKNAANTLREEMDKHERGIMSVAEDHSSKANEFISVSAVGVQATQVEIDTFADKTMKYDEEVAPLLHRNNIEYNSQFTSTPSEDFIIQSIVLPSEDLREFETTGVAEMAETAETAEVIEVNPIKEIRRDEEISVVTSKTEAMSSTSDVTSQVNVLPRPPMFINNNAIVGKENENNRKNAKNNARSRSRSRSRPSKDRVHKKRAQSRTKQNSARKRIPTMKTPTKA